MTTTEVIRNRELAGNNKMLKIFCDNALTFFAGHIENYECIWDDVNGCFYQLRPNVSAFTQVDSPIEITVVDYEQIQNMVILTNIQETIEFLTDRGYTSEMTNATLKKLKVLTGSMVNTTHVRTEAGYSDGSVKPE